jgi:hypothetical protein
MITMVESLPKVFMQRTFLPFLGVWQMAMMNKEVNCEKFSCHVKSIAYLSRIESDMQQKQIP